jgi:hypothetical protein
VTSLVYRRLQHAGHYLYGNRRGGHDLEQWIVRDGEFGVRRPGIPSDARCSHGYRDATGTQFFVWERTAPLSDGRCERCGGAS